VCDVFTPNQQNKKCFEDFFRFPHRFDETLSSALYAIHTTTNSTIRTMRRSNAASASDIRRQQNQLFEELFGSPGKTPPPCLH
jgi:hypothetical protein